MTEKWNCRTVTYLGDILVIAQLSDVDSVTHFTDDMDRFCKMASVSARRLSPRESVMCAISFRSFHSLITVQRMQPLIVFYMEIQEHQYRRDGSTGERG